MAARVAKQAVRASGTAALCRLLELPEELLLRALEYLDMAALQAAGSACAALRRLGAGPELVEAAARGSGEFWAPLAFSEPARSRIQHLLPRAAEGGPPTIGALRLFFSGTQPVTRDVGEMYLYGTVERGGDVVATCGPVDADLMNVKIEESRDGYFHGLKIPFRDWKSAAVEREYSQDDSPHSENETLSKKSATISTYAVTKSGAWQVQETSLKSVKKLAETAPEFAVFTSSHSKAIGKACPARSSAGMLWKDLNASCDYFPITDTNFEQFCRAFESKGQQRIALLLEICRHFCPTHRISHNVMP
jgi:hypothetical protein